MNIFVIEDEPPILREIIAIINSFHEDYHIIGKAQNGQEAMVFLQSQGQSLGMKSYGACVDLLVADFLENIE